MFYCVLFLMWFGRRLTRQCRLRLLFGNRSPGFNGSSAICSCDLCTRHDVVVFECLLNDTKDRCGAVGTRRVWKFYVNIVNMVSDPVGGIPREEFPFIHKHSLLNFDISAKRSLEFYTSAFW